MVLALLATVLSGCASASDPLAGSTEPASCAPSSSRTTPAAVPAQLLPGLTFDTQTDEVLQVHVTTPVLPDMPVLNERLRQDAANDLTAYRAQVNGDPGGELNVAWSLLGVSTRSVGVLLTEDRISGSVVLDSANPTDGSCGSCHKQKHGTLGGTLSNGALALTLEFPQGGSDITPLCGITMHAASSDIASGRIAATYTGTTTCEGPITDGKLTVTR